MSYKLLLKNDMQILKFEWGKLIWYANSNLGQHEFTLGFCHIYQGWQNYIHIHPNCVETLHVLKGKILHSIGSDIIEMKEGDTITIQPNISHNAKNIGQDTAELSISFSSGDRETININDGKNETSL